MNKIVFEHYPVEKLPEELRAKIRGWHSITLTLEEEKPASFTRQDLLALKGKPAGPSVNRIDGVDARRSEEVRRDLLSLIGKPASPSINTFEDIRAMRDEWD